MKELICSCKYPQFYKLLGFIALWCILCKKFTNQRIKCEYCPSGKQCLNCRILNGNES